MPGVQVRTWHTDATVAMVNEPLPQDVLLFRASAVLEALGPYVKSGGAEKPIARDELYKRALVVHSGSSIFDDKQRAQLVKRLQSDGHMRANCPSVESVDVRPKPAGITLPNKDYDEHLGAITSVSQELWTVKQRGFRRYYVVSRQARPGDRQTYHMVPLLADPMRPTVVVLAATATAPAVIESQVRDEYERWVALGTATEFKVRHILCKTQPDAQAALDRVRAGEDFAKVAAELSIDKASGAKGGDLGWSAASVFVPAFADAMKSLQPKGMAPTPVSTSSAGT